ncbi:MAG TPA: hypothetical protein VHC43_11105 [Mycobacteriales bacterium]|nr:hypothetical protein [Mycobacteriales bacterium]
MTRSRLGSLVATAATALVIVAATPAWAGESGTTSRTQTVGSASWGAAGSTTSGSPTIGTPFTLSWTVTVLGVNPQFFKVVNTGTTNLNAETYTTTISGGPKVVLTACVGADWTTVLGLGGSCAGTQVALGDSSSGATAASVSIPAGSYVSVKAAATGVLSLGSYTTSISVAVSRSQARAARTTNS